MTKFIYIVYSGENSYADFETEVDAMEFAKDKETQLIDGVKILMGKGDWVLVLPDPDKPFVNLTVESSGAKESDELLQMITEKVNSWKTSD